MSTEWYGMTVKIRGQLHQGNDKKRALRSHSDGLKQRAAECYFETIQASANSKFTSRKPRVTLWTSCVSCEGHNFLTFDQDIWLRFDGPMDTTAYNIFITFLTLDYLQENGRR
jgi:hypothetical protein